MCVPGRFGVVQVRSQYVVYGVQQGVPQCFAPTGPTLGKLNEVIDKDVHVRQRKESRGKEEEPHRVVAPAARREPPLG